MFTQRAATRSTPSSEYERWLIDGDIDVAVALLRRLAAQVTRTKSFPHPPGYQRWDGDAVDELLVQMIDKKKGVAFLLDTLRSVDNQGSAERYLLTCIENFLKDQAKSTPHGKLRERLNTVLGNDSRFSKLTSPVSGWRLSGTGSGWWQGDVDDLHRVARRVRGVVIRRWNEAGPTPQPARAALITVAEAILQHAGGAVRAEDLARVLLERFRYAIAPESATGVSLEKLTEASTTAGDPEPTLNSIASQQLWDMLTDAQRAAVPYLLRPDEAATGLGAGRRQAAAMLAQVSEIIRLATIDDAQAESVVMGLLEIGERG